MSAYSGFRDDLWADDAALNDLIDAIRMFKGVVSVTRNVATIGRLEREARDARRIFAILLQRLGGEVTISSREIEAVEDGELERVSNADPMSRSITFRFRPKGTRGATGP